MAYITITNSEIDANSPLLFSLGRKFRDNPEAIAGSGASPVLYLLPPARCSTGAGMFRADLRGGAWAQRVTVSPYLTGQPPLFFSASISWTVPAGWRKLHVELWGAGQGSDGTFNGQPGGWVEAFLSVTPGEVLAIALGAGQASAIGQDSDIKNAALAVLARAPGGASVSAAVGFTSDLTGARSGGFKNQGFPAFDDGPRNYGGPSSSFSVPSSGGACLIRGIA